MGLSRYIILSLIFSFHITQSQDVNWITLDEAQELQKKDPKNIIMDIYTDWCGPCKLMDKNTFQNPEIAKYLNENFYAVKFNAEGNSTVNYKGKDYKNPGYVEGKYGRNSSHNFTRYLGVYAYPTIVFFDDNTNPIAPITGYLTPQQIEIYLSLFREKKYLEVKSQEDFKKFISEYESVL
tara:strand:+ start:511 stop:1050 length:540 start_codon:yes stop_codon:yes gene_type:complete